MVGEADLVLGDGVVTSLIDLTGTATYTGAAAGKFAISDPIFAISDPTVDDNSGHFTADATLTAKFGASADAKSANGLTGTIDNFVLNDADEVTPWSVTLLRRGWGAADDDAVGVTVIPG